MPENATPKPQLIYFADPMCSWCWGFQPAIAALQDTYGGELPIRLILGGLRPGTTEPMHEKAKATTRSHWEHVRQASGQPFDFAFFDRERFVYDTEPAARAVVAMRLRDEAKALPFLGHVQHAFYAQNIDVTSVDALAGLAAQYGFPEEEFRTAMALEETGIETQTDFMLSQRTGVTGFPTMIAGYGDERPWALVTQGFQPTDRILALVDQWLGAAG